MAEGTSGEEVRIPVVEENVHLHRREVASGRVRVHTRTAVDTETLETMLEHDSIEIERVPIGREVLGEIPKVRTECGVTIVPVFEEVLVVEKRLVLKEEIHLVRRRGRETVEVPVERRRQVVDIERQPG